MKNIAPRSVNPIPAFRIAKNPIYLHVYKHPRTACPEYAGPPAAYAPAFNAGIGGPEIRAGQFPGHYTKFRGNSRDTILNSDHLPELE